MEWCSKRSAHNQCAWFCDHIASSLHCWQWNSHWVCALIALGTVCLRNIEMCRTSLLCLDGRSKMLVNQFSYVEINIECFAGLLRIQNILNVKYAHIVNTKKKKMVCQRVASFKHKSPTVAIELRHPNDNSLFIYTCRRFRSQIPIKFWSFYQ